MIRPLTLLKDAPRELDSLSIQQIIALCGDGKLSDGSNCSVEFRDYLRNTNSNNLRKYLQAILQSPFDRSGFVLQDIVNEFGRRLDYAVTNGRYQGRPNAVGYDGLWDDSSGHCIVVEVKTTDAYRINLDTVTQYRDELMASGRNTNKSSVLIVVGRQDTGDLEAQVRGSKHAWSARLISADALAKLVGLKEDGDLESVGKIHELLIPFEYTKLDKIIEIAFAVAEDIQEEEHAEALDNIPAGEEASTRSYITSAGQNSLLRARILQELANKYGPLVKKSRALYWSADRKIRAVISVSKKSPDGAYWYGYHLAWDKFLEEAEQGFYVLGCLDRNEAYALPFKWIHARKEDLSVTIRGDKRHWLVFLDPTETGGLALRSKHGQEPLEQFKIPMDQLKSGNSPR